MTRTSPYAPAREQCPECARPLQAVGRDVGLVWVCGACLTVFATSPVARRLVSDEFARELRVGATSASERLDLRCPFCAARLVQSRASLAGRSHRLLTCRRCHAVRLDRAALERLEVQAHTPAREARARDAARATVALLSLFRSLRLAVREQR